MIFLEGRIFRVSIIGDDTDLVNRGPVVRVAIDALNESYALRMRGADNQHARMLAETDEELPPIIVHRSTMRVIDGVHRVKAAMLRGDTRIPVSFYDGSDEDAFILAVRANVKHGLPLSLPDRHAAVVRILRSHPEWSDRKIAAATGLGATSVASIRRRSTARAVQSNAGVRVGVDGRVRPLDGARGRALAIQMIREKPDATVRAIASAAGVSPSTALDVRKRLRNGEDPIPRRLREVGRNETAAQFGQEPLPNLHDPEVILRTLKADPSLRFTDAGRALIRWLDSQTSSLLRWKNHADEIPPHCRQAVVALAKGNADMWNELADTLTQDST